MTCHGDDKRKENRLYLSQMTKTNKKFEITQPESYRQPQINEIIISYENNALLAVGKW